MTTNPYKGETSIVIGEKACKLVYDWNALAEVQAVAGELALQEIFTMKIKLLSQLLMIGLKKHHPEMDEATIMAASPVIYEVQQALSKAMELTYWGPDGPPKEDQPPVDADKKKPTPSEQPSS